MRNHEKRLKRLEKARPKGAPIILVEDGETYEQAWQRHLAEHPEDEKAEFYIILGPLDQASPSGPPPPRPQPPKRPGAAGTRTKQIIY